MYSTSISGQMSEQLECGMKLSSRNHMCVIKKMLSDRILVLEGILGLTISTFPIG